MNKKLVAFLMCLMIMLCVCGCGAHTPIESVDVSSLPESAMRVHFIDVDQGDSILLESDGRFVLIDAGEKEYGNTVCNYLTKLGVETLDYVIATHPHTDHCGGLTQVINTFECSNFITAETDQSTKTWIDVLLAVDENDVNYIDAVVSESYSFGEAYFEILAPCSSTFDNYNDYSVVVKAVCGDTSFLLTGDAETTSEKEMLNSGADLKADVLKVAHHGSTTSSCDEFLDAVSPDYAVISCGVQNEYGHPHTEIIDALNIRGITTYRTDELGTIVALSDKKNVTFKYTNTDIVVEEATQTQAQTEAETQAQTECETEPATVRTGNGGNGNKGGGYGNGGNGVKDRDRLQKEDCTTSQQDDSDTTTSSYIGNKNSKKFHLDTCQSVSDMNENNKVIFNTRQDAVDKGYTPCKNCCP